MENQIQTQPCSIVLNFKLNNHNHNLSKPKELNNFFKIIQMKIFLDKKKDQNYHFPKINLEI